MTRWRFHCIGPGPGPKNVLAYRDDGEAVVFTYRNWLRLKEEHMADDNGVYMAISGIVQQFKKDGVDKPVVTVGNVNGQNVYNFTIKTFGTQKLVSVGLWPEFEDYVQYVGRGTLIAGEGKLREERKGDNVYYNWSPSSLVIQPAVTRKEREVVNAQPVAAPVAAVAPEVAVAAPAAPAVGPTQF